MALSSAQLQFRVELELKQLHNKSHGHAHDNDINHSGTVMDTKNTWDCLFLGNTAR